MRVTIRRWKHQGLGGLWEALGRGAKRKWQKADLQSVEQSIEQDTRSYNSHQLVQKLAEQRQVMLSPRRLRLKTHEIAGRMFEDEYDLAMAVIDGMEARSKRGGYPLERFKFNSG